MASSIYFPEDRPDVSDRRSFPSGHAAVSFAAGATREIAVAGGQGSRLSFVASFVGIIRVEARKHHWYDALAGAATGTESGFLAYEDAHGCH
jgi:membrane-associated phospholipid phosphatase